MGRDYFSPFERVRRNKLSIVYPNFEILKIEILSIEIGIRYMHPEGTKRSTSFLISDKTQNVSSIRLPSFLFYFLGIEENKKNEYVVFILCWMLREAWQSLE